MFQTRYRQTAVGLTYSLAGVVGGALPPLVAASIISRYGAFTFGVILAIVCAVGVLCAIGLRETRHVDLEAVEAAV
jgi:fucose permease